MQLNLPPPQNFLFNLRISNGKKREITTAIEESLLFLIRSNRTHFKSSSKMAFSRY